MHCYQFKGELRIPAAAGLSAGHNGLGTKGYGGDPIICYLSSGLWGLADVPQILTIASCNISSHSQSPPPHTTPKEIQTFYSRGLANNMATFGLLFR